VWTGKGKGSFGWRPVSWCALPSVNNNSNSKSVHLQVARHSLDIFQSNGPLLTLSILKPPQDIGTTTIPIFQRRKRRRREAEQFIKACRANRRLGWDLSPDSPDLWCHRSGLLPSAPATHPSLGLGLISPQTQNSSPSQWGQ
jgi:hypothetical protein